MNLKNHTKNQIIIHQSLFLLLGISAYVGLEASATGWIPSYLLAKGWSTSKASFFNAFLREFKSPNEIQLASMVMP